MYFSWWISGMGLWNCVTTKSLWVHYNVEAMHYCVWQNDKMREEYIKNVKGGRLKRLFAFLADRDWNAEGGVSFSLAI